MARQLELLVSGATYEYIGPGIAGAARKRLSKLIWRDGAALVDDQVALDASIVVFAIAPGEQHRALRQEQGFPLVAAHIGWVKAGREFGPLVQPEGNGSGDAFRYILRAAKLAQLRNQPKEDVGVDLQTHCGFHSISPSILFCFLLFRPANLDKVQK